MASSQPKQHEKNFNFAQAIYERAEATRAAAARHLPPSGLSDRDRHLSRMEGKLLDIVAWANALRALGTAPNVIEPDAVLVIARALDRVALEIHDDWEGASNAPDNLPEVKGGEGPADGIARRQAGEIQLGDLSIRELVLLYDEFGAAADGWHATCCRPYFSPEPPRTSTAAGVLAVIEADRAGWIRDRIAQEVRSRAPADGGERDRILSIRIRHEIECEDRIRDRALLSEITEAWG